MASPIDIAGMMTPRTDIAHGRGDGFCRPEFCAVRTADTCLRCFNQQPPYGLSVSATVCTRGGQDLAQAPRLTEFLSAVMFVGKANLGHDFRVADKGRR
jgi:hypothetical protein